MSNLQSVITSNAHRTRRLELSEFHEDLDGSYIDVWLNLSDDFLERWNAYQEEIAAQREWFTTLAVEERTPEEEQALLEEIERRRDAITRQGFPLWAGLWRCEPEVVEGLWKADKAVFTWATKRTWEIIGDYRAGRAKKGSC
jgi:hypothetical protein